MAYLSGSFGGLEYRHGAVPAKQQRDQHVKTACRLWANLQSSRESLPNPRATIHPPIQLWGRYVFYWLLCEPTAQPTTRVGIFRNHELWLGLFPTPGPALRNNGILHHQY